MQKISYAGCLGLSPDFLSQLILKMCDAAKNCKKNYKKTRFFGGGGVQGHLRSSMLIN